MQPPMEPRARNLLLRHDFGNEHGELDIAKLEKFISSGEILITRNFGPTTRDTIIKWLSYAKSAQHRLHVDAANAPQAGATCPHCGNPIILVAPETPRQ